jgi:predicted nucleic acid-binding protein
VERRGSPLTVVIDASVVATALTGIGDTATWARALLRSEELVAPHMLPAEVASMLRHAVLLGEVSVHAANYAHTELLAMRVSLLPYEPFAERIWELRGSVTPYDAWYVALAESLGFGLATLDGPLARAPGPRCTFVTPPAG